MKKQTVSALLGAIALAAGGVHAAIITTSITGGATAAGMVDALTGTSSGITVSNITYTGANNASGVFTGGSGVIGFEQGILLTSGSASNVIGPNTLPNTSTDNGLPGDASLNTLVPGTQDASVLEFDFTPTGNRVTFSYVFGSEEYNEFVNAGVNDVFGFFINGINVALLPGTSTPVSIDTVNLGLNAGSFVNNEGGGLNTQLDGLTTVLFIDAAVNPNVLNHLKIAIADVGDSIYDSAVFIQTGTFTVCGGPGQPPCTGGDPDPNPNPVPEPASLALFGLGIAGLASVRRKRK